MKNRLTILIKLNIFLKSSKDSKFIGLNISEDMSYLFDELSEDADIYFVILWEEVIQYGFNTLISCCSEAGINQSQLILTPILFHNKYNFIISNDPRDKLDEINSYIKENFSNKDWIATIFKINKWIKSLNLPSVDTVVIDEQDLKEQKSRNIFKYLQEFDSLAKNPNLRRFSATSLASKYHLPGNITLILQDIDFIHKEAPRAKTNAKWLSNIPNPIRISHIDLINKKLDEFYKNN